MNYIKAIVFSSFVCTSVNAQNFKDGQAEFKCSDSELERGFQWAKQQALSYVRRNSDPVGDWYEASLPQRDAFCMRDVSHQLTGANVLGLADINKNILLQFVKSISASRDWCGYWEIDKLSRPAPVDYRNDSDFWYNLPGNFDIVDACLRQYSWTGDSTFLTSPAFLNFYQHTCREYIASWDTNHDGIMEGTVSSSVPFRGIGSYDESNGKLLTGCDLIASQSLGYRSFGTILSLAGNDSEGKIQQQKSEQLVTTFQTQWWDTKNQSYFGFVNRAGEFVHNDPMQLFLLRWDLVPPHRLKPVLDNLIAQEEKMNVEMRSYLAREVFRFGNSAVACKLLKNLTSPQLVRREYPEVSFAALEAYTEGLMGIIPDAASHSISTHSRLPQKSDTASISMLPIFDGYISVQHIGSDKTRLENKTHQSIYWDACFFSDQDELLVNGKKQMGELRLDKTGRKYVLLRTLLEPGKTSFVELR